MIATLRAAGCVFAEDEAAVLVGAAASPSELDAMVARRVAGLPLEQVVGWAEFCGLRIVVEPGVFVPRRRSEFLVEQAVSLTRPGAVVVDLCCGSGAVGAAIVAQVADVELHAVDVDAAAVRCARRNLAGASVHRGDLYDPLPTELRGRVDVLVAVVPYVPTDAIRLMPPEARDHEPRAALDGGADGLDVLRRMAAGAGAWLRPGGHVLFETSERQAGPATAAMESHGLVTRVATFDDLGATVVIGTCMFDRLHHTQLAMPAGEEERARAFFVGVLGMTELDKPAVLAARGGAWFRAGGVELHLGVEAGFSPARKAHPGILVTDLDGLCARLVAAGMEPEWDDGFPGHRRFYAADPFGNRLEFLQPISEAHT